LWVVVEKGVELVDDRHSWSPAGTVAVLWGFTGYVLCRLPICVLSARSCSIEAEVDKMYSQMHGELPLPWPLPYSGY
jgi:hypothetical protein